MEIITTPETDEGFAQEIFGALCWRGGFATEGRIVAVAMTHSDAITACVDRFDRLHLETTGVFDKYPVSKSREAKWQWIKRHARAAVIPLKVTMA